MSERADRHLALARAYAEAARRVLAAGIDGTDRLPFFALAAHALELALKAILIRAGWDEERLMMIGHDLDRCHAAATKSDAALAGVAGVVAALACPHASQCFRYPQALPRDLPDPAQTLDCLHQVLNTADRRQRDESGRAQGAA